MLYPHFSENYLSCFKFAIFLPTNFSEEPYFCTIRERDPDRTYRIRLIIPQSAKSTDHEEMILTYTLRYRIHLALGPRDTNACCLITR